MLRGADRSLEQNQEECNEDLPSGDLASLTDLVAVWSGLEWDWTKKNPEFPKIVMSDSGQLRGI